MVKRTESGVVYTQNFNAENQLTSVTVSGQTTSFYYDPDGSLLGKVKPDGSATLYLGGLYEVDLTSSGVTTKKTTYYPGGAMRVDIVGGPNTLYYSLRDHLGSASVLLDTSGNLVTNGEQRYYPFGESRLTTADLKTDHLFTGQLSVGLGGIYSYGARMYSPKLGRFLSADTIVPSPSDPQAINRFSYVRNSPLNYVDPTGHIYDDWADCSDGKASYTTPNSNGQAVSQADCWKYNQEVNLLLNGGVTFDVLSEANQDTVGLLNALKNASGVGFYRDGFVSDYTWSEATAATQAFAHTARALGKALGPDDWMESHAAEVFKAVFNGASIIREFGDTTPGGDWGFVLGSTLSAWPAGLRDVNFYIHELGHIFDNRLPGQTFMKASIDGGYFKLSGGGFAVRRAGANSPLPYHEQAADMFLGFVVGFDVTLTGRARQRFMEINMAGWLSNFNVSTP